MSKHKTVKYFKEEMDCKKVAVYQNLKFFIIPTLFYEYINPNHKILVWGIKKRKHRKVGYKKYEKIALLLKNSLPIYLLIAYTVIGWYLLC